MPDSSVGLEPEIRVNYWLTRDNPRSHQRALLGVGPRKRSPRGWIAACAPTGLIGGLAADVRRRRHTRRPARFAKRKGRRARDSHPTARLHRLRTKAPAPQLGRMRTRKTPARFVPSGCGARIQFWPVLLWYRKTRSLDGRDFCARAVYIHVRYRLPSCCIYIYIYLYMLSKTQSKFPTVSVYVNKHTSSGYRS